MNRRRLLKALLATAALPWVPWRAFRPGPDYLILRPAGYYWLEGPLVIGDGYAGETIAGSDGCYVTVVDSSGNTERTFKHYKTIWWSTIEPGEQT